MGGTVEEELKDGVSTLSSITPKIGRMVIFDHRALHEGTKSRQSVIKDSRSISSERKQVYISHRSCL